MSTADMKSGSKRDYELAEGRIGREMRQWDREQAIEAHRGK